MYIIRLRLYSWLSGRIGILGVYDSKVYIQNYFISVFILFQNG